MVFTGLVRSDFNRYLLLPSLVWILVLAFIKLSSFDFVLADYLYQWEGSTWLFKESFIAETLLHKGGRVLVSFMGWILLGLVITSYKHKGLASYTRGLWYVFLSAISSALIVNLLKRYTHMDCPWDMVRYGGLEEYLSLFESFRLHKSTGACFPAGHASAAYCWFGLFFFAKRYCPQWQFAAIVFVITLGILFGVAQQLRGAHFLSHDLWTAWLCWIVAYFYSVLFFPVDREQPGAVIA